jgi:hypothetical protein
VVLDKDGEDVEDREGLKVTLDDFGKGLLLLLLLLPLE